MRIVCWHIIPYFLRKLRKMYNLLSAAVMIGPLRVKSKGTRSLWLNQSIKCLSIPPEIHCIQTAYTLYILDEIKA